LLRLAPAGTMGATVRPGITFKLFLAILAASVVAAAAMALATRYSFHSGFLGYLAQVDAQRLEALSTALADNYRRSGGWDFVRGDYARLREIAISAASPQVTQRLTVLDGARRLVVGNPEVSPDATLRPVQVEGRPVGWVARAPLRRLSSAAEDSFEAQQGRAAWGIAALALALAAALAFVLARAFLLPLKRIAEATHRLAGGNYATRVVALRRDELGRLALDFNRLAETLERNETLRRRFMADVSHELRTPLAVLSAELEALDDGVRPLTREALASLRGEVGALGKLVDDLNQLALADVGALAYRKLTLELAPLIEQAVDSYRERFAQRGVSLEASGAPGARVFGDADRLMQMFRNLLENSARYTDPGGCARVSTRVEDGSVAVDFDDSPPGVPAGALPHLFERFYRVDASRSRANGGAGLGLAISRSIAAAHGGELSASPSPLGGLRVTVRLPLAS
jgi:two-component system, OmpR family, sensor histidine kinase BaeS